MVLGKNYLLTFQERPGDCFDVIRTAIRNEASATRHGVQPDYLAYRLIDASIDAYFPVLEGIGDHLDQLDDRTIAADSRSAFAELHSVKRELLMLRRAIWPLRDALNELRRESTPFVTDVVASLSPRLLRPRRAAHRPLGVVPRHRRRRPRLLSVVDLQPHERGDEDRSR